MKALSLIQPYATLVAITAKIYETRSWKTTYRGAIAIHASKAFPREYIELCFTEPFASTLATAGIKTPGDLPRGQVIATAQLTDCLSTTSYRIQLTDQENAFGDFSPSRYAFTLERVIALLEPIPARGALGIWEWTPPAGFKP